MTNKGKVITYKLLWILLLCAASFLISATASFAKKHDRLKKILLSSFVLIAGILFLVEKPQAYGEPAPNYVPLKFSFEYYGSPVCWGNLSADMIVNVFGLKYIGGAAYDPSKNMYETEGPEVFTPSLEDWKAFFDVCESADIWDIGKDNGYISADIAVTNTLPVSWSLTLEYPGRKLEINGVEKYAILDVDFLICHLSLDSEDKEMRAILTDIVNYTKKLPGLDHKFERDVRLFISDSIDIVMKYKEIQSVWDALGKYIIKGKRFPLLEELK